MSPILKSAEAVGQEMVSLKSRPYQISPVDFYTTVDKTKAAFSKIINADDPGRVAIIPSVSYGIANVTNNIDLQPGEEILMPYEQFPSNYYSWKRLADTNGGVIKSIKSPAAKKKTALWNEAILEAITTQTKVVAISNTHWADGTIFDLEKIGARCREVGAYLIIDGTQSIGALPFDQKKVQADAIICAGYKWLLGPYSIGVAYYGPKFDTGIPIEENWINRHESENFQNLVNYQDNYKPKAARYSVGEQSNFILIPMQLQAFEQILDWGVHNIQNYCKELTKDALNELQSLGVDLEDGENRAHHLFGMYLNDRFDLQKLKEILAENKVFVSFRGNAIRVAPHVYNHQKDLEALVNCFKKLR
ncbi:MAG: aminotransferase class V-fold PLP-dependent enzyme [Bacteroidetes bacterium]|nr:MAG: aminotransferase class V-fold PLP-dependent enzyme [Bacteroidota bacterium]